MNIIASTIQTFEQAPVPDAATRFFMNALVARTSRQFAKNGCDETAAFVRDMRALPIAVHTDIANTQHYEVPAEFFALTLGARRKYSCCFYESETSTLDAAEAAALALTAERARLADGQRILELGCGWGSLSLWMAEAYPGAEITAVSNSHSQRAYIEKQAAKRNIENLQVITADAQAFKPDGHFDRLVSIEMFEHMANWGPLLARAKSWLKPDGLMFMHVFSHVTTPYRFDHNDPADWIGNYFFTGGLMPNHDLIKAFTESFTVTEDWRWSGAHYARTANDWLANFDRNSDEIMKMFKDVYGSDARIWHRRWRLFFLATATLFGYADGREWGVSHYLLKPTG